MLKKRTPKAQLYFLEDFLRDAKAIHGDYFSYDKVAFKYLTDKITVTCPVHGDYTQSVRAHVIDKRGCKPCSMAQVERRSVDELVKAFRQVHGQKYDYSLVTSPKTKDKVDVVCREHGVFKLTANSHLNGAGCKKCSVEKRALAATVSVDEVYKRLSANGLSHLKLHEKTYESVTVKADFSCPEHGRFSRIVADLLKSEYGCPTCGNEASVAAHRMSAKQFLEKARTIHGDEFEYDLSNWHSSTRKIRVKCKDHGWFEQMPYQHVNGKQKCMKCYRSVIAKAGEVPFSEFERRAREKHKWVYQYWPDNYRGVSYKVRITCGKHGDFWQTGSDHLDGHGCPSCGGRAGSKGETEVFNYVKSLGFTPVKSAKIPNTNFEIDVFVPELNLGIEYHGLYWHSSKFTGRSDHEQKHLLAKAAGIRLIQIFSDEWHNRKQACKYLIAGALGKSSETLGARQTRVEAIDAQTANQFFDRWHVQGAAGHGDYYGLTCEGKLVAVMGFSKVASSRSRLGDDCVELTRYAANRRVTAGASKLIAHYLKRHPSVRRVISFSDNRWFTGKMYEALGFKFDGDVSKSYYYCTTSATDRWHKSGFQRSELKKKFPNFNPDLSERQNCEANGYYQIWDCGKKRWVLEVS